MIAAGCDAARRIEIANNPDEDCGSARGGIQKRVILPAAREGRRQETIQFAESSKVKSDGRCRTATSALASSQLMKADEHE